MRTQDIVVWPPKQSGVTASERRSFGQVLRDELIDRGYTTSIGHADWPGFAAQLDGIRYESLRKAVTGERVPSLKIMEACAAALGLEPTIFWECQLARARRSFDIQAVGADAAFANLRRWLDAQ